MQVLLFWSNFGHRDTDRLLIYLRLHDKFAAGRRHSFDFDSQRLRGDVVGEGFERGKDELLLFDLHADFVRHLEARILADVLDTVDQLAGDTFGTQVSVIVISRATVSLPSVATSQPGISSEVISKSAGVTVIFSPSTSSRVSADASIAAI